MKRFLSILSALTLAIILDGDVARYIDLNPRNDYPIVCACATGV